MDNAQSKSVGDASDALYQKELLATCKQKSASFRKFFNTLFIFSLAFGFFVAWPYLSTIQSAESQRNQLKQQRSELAVLQGLQKKYEIPRNKIMELSVSIKSGAGMLRAYIASLQKDRRFDYPSISEECTKLTDTPMAQDFRMQQQVSPDMAQAANNSFSGAQTLQAQIPAPGPKAQSTDECLSSSGEQQMICKVDRFVQYQLCEYEQSFDKGVLRSLSTLSDADQPLFNESELADEFQKMREILRSHIQQKPRFWITVQGKGEMSITLDTEIKNLWKALREKIQPVMDGLDVRIDDGNSKIALMKRNQKSLTERQKQLSARITEIESPIGKLPIGLTESVLVYPILLAFGFWFTAGIFVEHAGLRVELKDIETRGELVKESLGSWQIARLAPLWIDPENNSQIRVVRVLALLIPFFAFVLTVAAIIYSQLTLSSTLFSQVGINAIVYWVLYGISAIGFLFVLLRITRTLSRLKGR